MKRKEKQKGGAQKVREKKARELQDFAARSKRLECFFAKSGVAGNYYFYLKFLNHILTLKQWDIFYCRPTGPKGH